MMKAKDFNKLKVRDPVLVVAPPGIIAQYGKVVAFVTAIVKDSGNNTGKATLEYLPKYRNEKTLELEHLNRPGPGEVSIVDLTPYTWAFHQADVYVGRTDYDRLAISDPAGFMLNEELGKLSWERAQQLYAAYKKNPTAPPRESLSHPNGGMQALLDYRSFLAAMLIKAIGPIAAEAAVQQRSSAAKPFQSRDKTDALALPTVDGFLESVKAPGGDAPGSSEPTSDIDLNTFNDGTEYLVAAFNENFAKMFGSHESGIVFDVNVYGKDFLPDLKKVAEFSLSPDKTKPPQEVPFVLPARDHVFIERSAEYEDASLQMTAAFVKLRRYMADRTFVEAQNDDERVELAPDWQGFERWLTVELDARIKSPKPTLTGVQMTAAHKMLSDAEKQFKANQQLLAGIVTFIKNRGANATKTARLLARELIDNPAPNSAPVLDPHNVNDRNALMAAENRIYEVKLQDVASKRTAFDVARFFEARRASVSPGAPPIPVDAPFQALRKALSEALYFANEAYVTSGAVTQVVGGKQSLSKGVGAGSRSSPSKANIAYGAHELMHSIIDNLADIYKETKRYYREHPGKAGAPEAAARVGGAVLKSSKYIHRMLNAIKHLYLIFGIVDAMTARLEHPVLGHVEPGMSDALLTETMFSILARNGPNVDVGVRAKIWNLALRRYPDKDFKSLDHFLVFRRIGFGLEALKKLDLDWVGNLDKTKQDLTALLKDKFSLGAPDGKGPYGEIVRVKADFVPYMADALVVKWASQEPKPGAKAIAASAISKYMTECLISSNSGGETYMTLASIQQAMTRMVIRVLADYFERFKNDERQDRLIAVAMTASGRPYPRLYTPGQVTRSAVNT